MFALAEPPDIAETVMLYEVTLPTLPGLLIVITEVFDDDVEIV